MNFQHVVTVKNMRESDARAIERSVTSAELMHRAAQGIFEAARFTGRVAVVCGKGNNGGDGYALACILCKNGITPTIFRACDGFSKDGLYYYKTALSLGAEEAYIDLPDPFRGYDIVVDCLLGTGFSGELSGEMREAVKKINASTAYIISADINSGLNGDTGSAELAVVSDLTVSIGAYKTGMFLGDAYKYIGKLRNADIGIELINEEYKLIDSSVLYMFEGYGSLVLTLEEFCERFGANPKTDNIAELAAEVSQTKRQTVVVKSGSAAVAADFKYVYFCAEYAD